MVIQNGFPENEYRFHRPIIWDTEVEEFRYIPGGTANLVRVCDHDFILTANHCLEKGDYYPLESAKIPYRLNSEAYCLIGKGANLLPKNPDEEQTALCDIRIHRLLGPSCPQPALERGEILEIPSFEPNPLFHRRYLSGFPKQLQWQDWENREIGGTGLTIDGCDGGPTNDAGCRKFHSDELTKLKANGFSGGLITTCLLGNVQVEGICTQGGDYLNFIRFISVEVIQDAFSRAWCQLIE